MSKVDKMFEELGYKYHEEQLGYDNWNNSLFDYIIFNEGRVDLGSKLPYTKEIHLAIHEKMKELGWLDE